jgi:hypothetical protein
MFPIDIRLSYWDQAGDERVRRLAFDEFFDPEDPLPQSIFQLTWRHGPPSELTNLPIASLAGVCLIVDCPSTHERIELAERLWAAGGCRTLDRKDSVQDVVVDWSRIVEVGTPEGIHFIRFDSASSELTGLRSHHVVLADERVRHIFPSRSGEE